MKKVIIALIIIVMIVGILSINANANSQMQVTKNIVNDNRSINLSFTNVPVLEDSCKWGITDKKDSTTVKKWYDVTETEYNKTNNALTIILNVIDDDIQNIVKSSDSIYFYIKNEENELKVEDFQINIKIPITKAFTLDKTLFYDDSIQDHFAYNISALYNIEKQYYVLEKVTDKNIINKYNENSKIEDFENMIDETKIPTSGWIEAKESVYQMDVASIKGLPNSILKNESGIYYVWIKAEDEQSKTVYGVALIKIGEIVQNNQQGEGRK